MSNPDLCIRITLPYQDCSGIISQWFLRADKAICYEHPADEEVSKTHVHLALIGLDCKTEALKRMWSDAPGKGNEFWSFSPMRDKPAYLGYMTKGILRASAAKSFSEEEMERSRLARVETTLVNSDKRTDPTEYMILKVIERFKHYDRQSYIEHYRYDKAQNSDTIFHSNEDYARSLLDEVRSATMKVYWGVNQRVPHATQYKIVAGSVFLRLCENFEFFESGIESIKNLWY